MALFVYPIFADVILRDRHVGLKGLDKPFSWKGSVIRAR